jgi:riboflavin synthase alpha subunit
LHRHRGSGGFTPVYLQVREQQGYGAPWLLLCGQGQRHRNGVSLTVCRPTEDTFQVCIIPYTFEHTNFHNFTVGTVVNLEFDIIGKYLARMNSLL